MKTTQPYIYIYLRRLTVQKKKKKGRKKKKRVDFFPNKHGWIHFALCNYSVFVIKWVQQHLSFPFVRFGCTLWLTEINNPVYGKHGKCVHLEYEETAIFRDLPKLPLLTWSWKLARNSGWSFNKNIVHYLCYNCSLRYCQSPGICHCEHRNNPAKAQPVSWTFKSEKDKDVPNN